MLGPPKSAASVLDLAGVFDVVELVVSAVMVDDSPSL